MQKVKPKKALGQHFLTDLGVARRIAATIADFRRLPALEVGPGMGVLTQFLLEEDPNLTVAEIDAESVAWLKEHFPGLRIVEGDFLEMDLREVMGEGEFTVIGNYPYNISSQIFFKVLDYREQIPCVAGMLQREVAERLAAGPGTKARGILSVLLQAWYDVEYLFTVSENVFNPPPKVKSGVIRCVRNGRKDLDGADPATFKNLVKTAFSQRRKTLRNSLRGLCPDLGERFADLAAKRPEQLTVEEFIALAREYGKSK